MVCVEDPTEDLDYVSKKCTMYEYDSGTVLVTFSPPKLYQAKGVDAEVQAEDLFIPPTSLN